MKILLLLFLAVPAVVAETVRIHSSHPEFVRLSDGRVFFWKNSGFPSGQMARIKIKKGTNELSQLEPLYVTREPEEEVNITLPDRSPPTVFRFERSITKVMNSFRAGELTDSQCYDRGHVWGYEADTKFNIKLQKGWIFFADHFILKYRFYWWFHIAPMALLKKDGFIQERVLDKTFAKKPLSFKEWSDLFLESKPTCKDIDLYTQYSLHADEDDCYYMRSSRFIWQPRDLEDFAITGNMKNTYIGWEISHAFKHAFNSQL